jgi:hypothetical protein
VRAKNPDPRSAFAYLRIQTTRITVEGGDILPFTSSDELFCEKFYAPAYSLCGLKISGESDHIAERASYEELVGLAENLIPGIQFPRAPTSRRKRG